MLKFFKQTFLSVGKFVSSVWDHTCLVIRSPTVLLVEEVVSNCMLEVHTLEGVSQSARFSAVGQRKRNDCKFEQTSPAQKRGRSSYSSTSSMPSVPVLDLQAAHASQLSQPDTPVQQSKANPTKTFVNPDPYPVSSQENNNNNVAAGDDIEVTKPIFMNRIQDIVVTMPSASDMGKQARKLICSLLYRAFFDLCKNGTFGVRDIFEKNTTEYVGHPYQDSTGVVFAANEIMRALVTDKNAYMAIDTMAFQSLSFQVRIQAAAALFLAYKTKMEESWSKGANIIPRVVCKFVTSMEYKSGNVEESVHKTISETELSIMQTLPTYSLMELNICTMVEYKIQQLVEEKILTPLAAIACMSVASFSFYIARCVVETPFLEQIEMFCNQYGKNCTADALVLVGVACLVSSFTTDVKDIPCVERLGFHRNNVVVAKKLLSTRLDLSMDDRTAQTHKTFCALCHPVVARKASELLLVCEMNWNASQQAKMYPKQSYHQHVANVE